MGAAAGSAAAGPADAQAVSLCVGGATFTTTLPTLCAVPGSYLATLFGSGRWQPCSLVPGSSTPFVDRDGQLFAFVLAYLRGVRDGAPLQQLALPEQPLQLRLLRAEAEFYGLPELALACSVARLDGQHGSAKQRLAGVMLEQQLQHCHDMHQQQQQQQQRCTAAAGLDDGSSVGVPWAAGHGRREQQPPSQQHEVAANCGGQPDGVVSAEGVDVQLAQQHAGGTGTHAGGGSGAPPALAAALLRAQQLRAQQQAAWAADAALRQHAGLVLRHLLHLPLAAEQPDLVAALAECPPGSRLELGLTYHAVGDTRIDLQCRILPPHEPGSSASAAAVAAAAAAAAATAGCSAAGSPNLSPRDGWRMQQQPQQPAAAGGSAPGSRRASQTTIPADAAGAAAAAAAAAAANSCTGAGVTPGPGWGGCTMYHRFTIREGVEQFVLTTCSPGEPPQVQEVPRATFRPELSRYSALHKLCVQQCPRASVAGLVWLLREGGGFGSVGLATCLDTYMVGGNAFSGFRSVITCEL